MHWLHRVRRIAGATLIYASVCCITARQLLQHVGTNLKLCRKKAACSRWSTSLLHAKLPCQSARGARLFKVIVRQSCSRCPCNRCCLASRLSMSASTCHCTQLLLRQHCGACPETLTHAIVPEAYYLVFMSVFPAMDKLVENCF